MTPLGLLWVACALLPAAALEGRGGGGLRGPGNLLSVDCLVHGNLSDYYLAAGALSALPEGLRASLVPGQQGPLHLFYLPKGPSSLGLAEQSGGRRASLSALVRLRDRKELAQVKAGFPQYHLSAGYQNPLSGQGQALEQTAVAGISEGQLMEDLRAVVSLPSGSSAPTRAYSNAAATASTVNLLRSKFQAIGLSTCLQSFQMAGGRMATNVIAFKPGAIADSVTVGAHYDSRPFEGRAPGAIDNGSGVAALLSMARAFTKAGISPRKSVYFTAFAAEEIGLKGSEAFADALAKGGGSIPSACRPSASTAFEAAGSARHEAIVMDEVAWRSPNLPTTTINLEAFDWASGVLENLAQASQAHNGDALRVVHSDYPFGSDHMPFLNRHSQAVLTIQGDDGGYQDYHKSTDNVENADPGLRPPQRLGGTGSLQSLPRDREAYYGPGLPE